ncbi:MAG TPA: hypothetical protein VHI13_20645 [Candidatus Kapabacteria bacterium]|nr:hypothetical protein [Candidatus Kapabacteria bacterium]
MLNAVVVDNGIHGLERMFRSGAPVRYRFERVGAAFAPDLSDADLLIVPNGSDHVAMYRARNAVRAFLERGGALFCFDGWFTDWVPGNRWVMDNSRATRDVRYSVRTDRHGLFNGVAIESLVRSHGISGWWACGLIELASGADVVMEDTWGRAMIVVDRVSTPGTLILTASGPLGDVGFDGTFGDLSRLYHNMLGLVSERGAQ